MMRYVRDCFKVEGSRLQQVPADTILARSLSGARHGVPPPEGLDVVVKERDCCPFVQLPQDDQVPWQFFLAGVDEDDEPPELALAPGKNLKNRSLRVAQLNRPVASCRTGTGAPVCSNSVPSARAAHAHAMEHRARKTWNAIRTGEKKDALAHAERVGQLSKDSFGINFF